MSFHSDRIKREGARFHDLSTSTAEQSAGAATTGEAQAERVAARRVLQCYTPALAVHTDLAEQVIASFPGSEYPGGVQIVSITELPRTAEVLDSEAEYRTRTYAQRDGAGGGATTVASFTTKTTGGEALAALTRKDVTLSTTLADVQIPADGVLTFANLETTGGGAGKACGECIHEVVIELL